MINQPSFVYIWENGLLGAHGWVCTMDEKSSPEIFNSISMHNVRILPMHKKPEDSPRSDHSEWAGIIDRIYE